MFCLNGQKISKIKLKILAQIFILTRDCRFMLFQTVCESGVLTDFSCQFLQQIFLSLLSVQIGFNDKLYAWIFACDLVPKEKRIFSNNITVNKYNLALCLNCTGNRAMGDFQQSLNNSCFRGMKIKCLPFTNYNIKCSREILPS